MLHARCPLVLSTLALLASTIPAAATEWNPPERVTANQIEDRTTSGSLFQFCYSAAAVWLEEQSGPGFRLVFSEREDNDLWSAPAPVVPGSFADYGPRLAGDYGDGCHLVWQRGSGTGGDIHYAYRPYGGGWVSEPVTANATEDLTPDIADLMDGDGRVHIVWVGFDPISGTGKIFHGTRTGGSWTIERLAASELGPFWTGAEPKVAVDGDGTVHVVYRGGDYGDYHAHYARKAGGQWTYQILASGNANDFTVDVTTGFSLLVGMSGNDGWGFPSRIYVTESTDGGLTFGPAILASGSYSAVLGNLTSGWMGTIVIGSEVSGNIYTGNAIESLNLSEPEYLPPVNQSTENPSGGQAHCITRSITMTGQVTALYTNTNGGPPDSAEVYFLTVPPPGAVGEGSPAPPAALRLAVAPNPMRGETTISFPLAPPPAGARALIADVAGRRVRDLTADLAASPNGRLRWDGRDASGRRVGAGVYLLRVEAPGHDATSRLVVIR